MQVERLFVTATGTDVGKTYVTLRLIGALANRGVKVGVCKPIETGVTGQPADAHALLLACQHVNPDFAGLEPADITAYTFPLAAAPFCADTQKAINLHTIIEKCDALQSRCDLLLIEGAGGLMVPITRELMMVDLATKLRARCLLVTPSRLGCINDTLLSLEALKAHGADFDWCVNLHEEHKSFEQVTRPYYDACLPGWWSAEQGLEQYAERIFARRR
jgi:dethiobiotin synthetase